MSKKRTIDTVPSAREAAYKILHEIFEKNAYSNLTMRYSSQMEKISLRDRALVTEIVYGTVRNKIYLDYIINKFVKNAKKVSGEMTTILRMSMYQLIACKSIPEHAVCNEAVLLAKKYINLGAGGFANAVLRNALRAKSTWDDIPAGREDIRYSCPPVIRDIIIKAAEKISFAGDGDAANEHAVKEVLSSMLEPAKVYLRVNTLVTDTDTFSEKLSKSGIVHSISDMLQDVIELKNGSDIRKISESAELGGSFTVQDPGASLPVYALDPQPGETVIDCCAAPGGKTVLIAEFMKNQGRIEAYDIHDFRVELVQKLCRSQGIDIVEARQCDAAAPADSESVCDAAADPGASGIQTKSMTAFADRILADVPCSGLGVIKRKPEIKWSFDAENTKALTEIQMNILETQSKKLKRGGIIVYSTCTLNPAENEEVIERFLAKNKEFELVPIEFDLQRLAAPAFAKRLPKQKSDCMITLLPGIYDTDGFFIAKMKRRA